MSVTILLTAPITQLLYSFFVENIHLKKPPVRLGGFHNFFATFNFFSLLKSQSPIEQFFRWIAGFDLLSNVHPVRHVR